MSIELPRLVGSDITWNYRWRVLPGGPKDVGRSELIQLFLLSVQNILVDSRALQASVNVR